MLKTLLQRPPLDASLLLLWSPLKCPLCADHFYLSAPVTLRSQLVFPGELHSKKKMTVIPGLAAQFDVTARSGQT